jgi:uncharacterized protein YjiS (DUF1127 family)
MSQIHRETQLSGRPWGPVARFSSVATLHGGLAARQLPEPWLASAWKELHAALEHTVDAISTWRARARMRRQLLLLDDRLLRDIGLTRLQARGEAEKPFWRV